MQPLTPAFFAGLQPAVGADDANAVGPLLYWGQLVP